MAWRGRGRGSFGRGQAYRHAKEEPFILFPEDVILPEPGHVLEKDALVKKKYNLENFYKASVYFLEEKDSKSNSQVVEIERYSDKNKPNVQVKCDLLSDFIKYTAAYFPLELLEGTNLERQPQKKLRWDPESDLQKLDIFEKLEGKYQGRDKKDEKAKKENEDENEEVGLDEEEEEESDDGDYNQNFDFDDDEDDLNMEDDDDGPVYDD